MTNRLQLFPVHNSSDLRRAIRHVEKSGDESERKYVINRARALGRADMIPVGWVMPSYRKLNNVKSLDDQFESYAEQFGISVVKLKTVFFRGVQEYEQSDADFGNAAVWGMARVQRFINGSCDEDLLPEVNDVEQDPGLEVTEESVGIVSKFLYGNLDQIFSPGRVVHVEFCDDTMHVLGTLDEDQWRYEINLTTGEHELKFV